MSASNNASSSRRDSSPKNKVSPTYELLLTVSPGSRGFVSSAKSAPRIVANVRRKRKSSTTTTSPLETASSATASIARRRPSSEPRRRYSSGASNRSLRRRSGGYIGSNVSPIHEPNHSK